MHEDGGLCTDVAASLVLLMGCRAPTRRPARPGLELHDGARHRVLGLSIRVAAAHYDLVVFVVGLNCVVDLPSVHTTFQRLALDELQVVWAELE